MTNSITVLLLALAVAQSVPSSARIDRVLRELAAGRRTLDGARIETECLNQGRFTKAVVHGTSVAIWDDRRQGTVPAPDVHKLFEMLVRENFARMPSSFGEAEEGEAAERMTVKMSCSVRFSGAGLSKTVVQLDRGRQSSALKRLARAVIDQARAATAAAPDIGSLDEALSDVAAGGLAVETLRITMRVGSGNGVPQANPGGWALHLDGRDLEIDPDAGAPANRRLNVTDVREIARSLSASGFAALPANVQSTGYVELTVAVLGREHAVQARPFAGRPAESALHERFTRAFAPLAALRR